MTDEQRVDILMQSEPYWTALAMKEQGSRFFRCLGAALDAADAVNRRLIYETWLDALWDFYGRGQRLEAAEATPLPEG